MSADWERRSNALGMHPTRLNKYELLRLIGVGGMAEVHLACMRGPYGIDKHLVVKRLLPELAANRRFVRMFLDEARLAVSLNHANIVQVYEVDEVDGVVFYAMELLHGHDVRQIARTLRVNRLRLPLAQAVTIVLAVCAGLHHAHELTNAGGEPLGIVHRDVSPHNVFVCFDGVVKVIDFGIAKAANRIDRTATGMLKGKFGYMSPEQCLSQPVDRRSDIFCIAVLLYEMTTGRRLYSGANEYQMLKRIVETSPEPPSAAEPGYPAELERIVMKGLKRDPAARYQTAEALARDLDAFARSLGLDASQAALARFMETVFATEVALWRAGARSPVESLGRRLDGEDEDETTDAMPNALNGSVHISPRGGAAPDVELLVDTKAGSVTETIEHPAPRWARLAPRAAAIAFAVAALSGAGWIAFARTRAAAVPPSVVPVETVAPAAVSAPLAATPQPATASAPASEAAVASATAPSAAARPTAGPQRLRAPRPASRATEPPAPRARPDPDAPLPR